MNKLEMQSANGVSINIEKIAALFPNCVTETTDKNGNICKGIDFDKLKEELSDDIIDNSKERYQFTWPDKRQAIHKANTPTNKTLRPCREDSVDFDNTENLYIEGDNLDVLKLLRENYLGKVKMIYIDPPYNTGNDFVYDDNFKMDEDLFSQANGEKDELGNRMVVNSDSNGRFHTDWLNMMYPRLKVAKDLLAEDGVVFISIDDHEVENLKKICDEIFGSKNFVAQLIWQRAYSPKNDAKYISNSHDYIILCAKNIENFTIGRLERTEDANARYKNPDNDPRGVWKPSDMSVKTYSETGDYPITTPSGRIVEPPAGRCWRLSKNAFLERLQDNRIWFGPDGNSVPSIKRFLTELKYEGMAPTSILMYEEVGHSQEGAKEVTSLFDGKGVFDGPKPVRLLERLLTIGNLNQDSIVLDFFSGSASTAHAVIKTNSIKGRNCKYIMVQLPEPINEKKKESGYLNICEIGKERIRRAAKKIKEEMEAEGKDTSKMDFGFRVLKLDSSNMKDVYYTPQETTPDLFSADNVKEDRTAEDLLFQVMPKCDLMLSEKIIKENIKGKDVYFVKDNYLAACFDMDLTDEVIKEIAKRQPFHFVMKEGGAAKDSVLDNFEQIFKTYSAGTKCMVI